MKEQYDLTPIRDLIAYAQAKTRQTQGKNKIHDDCIVINYKRKLFLN